MPVRRRRPLHRLDTLSFFQTSDLLCGRTRHFRDEAEREAAWHRHKADIMATPSQVDYGPHAFWCYEPVPDYLRDFEPGEATFATDEDEIAAEEALERARAEWLRDNEPEGGWFNESEAQ